MGHVYIGHYSEGGIGYVKHSETSRAAAESVVETSVNNRYIIAKILAENPLGLTRDEITAILATKGITMLPSIVSTRLNELVMRDMSHIPLEDGKVKMRAGKSGRMQAVYMATGRPETLPRRHLSKYEEGYNAALSELEKRMREENEGWLVSPAVNVMFDTMCKMKKVA